MIKRILEFWRSNRELTGELENKNRHNQDGHTIPSMNLNLFLVRKFKNAKYFFKKCDTIQSYKCFHLVVNFTQSAYLLNNTCIVSCKSNVL
jgi:hypothetical protein